MKVRDHVVRCIEESGRSFTVMAYGQTGSGKTYTMTAIEGTLHLTYILEVMVANVIRTCDSGRLCARPREIKRGPSNLAHPRDQGQDEL
jgi:hypothetical protein